MTQSVERQARLYRQQHGREVEHARLQRPLGMPSCLFFGLMGLEPAGKGLSHRDNVPCVQPVQAGATGPVVNGPVGKGVKPAAPGSTEVRSARDTLGHGNEAAAGHGGVACFVGCNAKDHLEAGIPYTPPRRPTWI